MRRLEIRPAAHNQGAFPTIPPSHARVRAILGAADRQTDTETRDQNTPRAVEDSL